jgi:hypothetical protein
MSDKPVLSYENSGPLLLEVTKEHYDQDQNPIHLMHAFTWAHEYKLDIPSWVIEKLDEVFNQYLDDGYTGSLDALMGCTRGRGQDRAKTEFERDGMYVNLMADMDVLIRRGVKVKDAAKISHDHNQLLHFFPPNPDKIRQMYYDWKPRLKMIGEYPPEDLPEILKDAPKHIIKKYPHLMEKYARLFKE